MPPQASGYTPSTDAITWFVGDFAFLSNFAPLDEPIQDLDGLRFPTAEHAYQAAKTSDPDERARVAAATTPGRAKSLGQTIHLRPDWDQARVKVMATILAAKFGQPRLRAALLATDTAKLVEGNVWHDTFWGVCFCPVHTGAGENTLGQLLEDLRERLRASAV